MAVRIIWTLLFLFCTDQLVHAQSKVKLLDTFLTSQHLNGTFNGNILLAEKGKIIYQNSFGFANETTHELLRPEHLFDLGSLSKQFTAMAIVLLKEQGKLSFDDPMTKYIPELKKYPVTTIKNLLQHTSGFPDYLGLDTLFDRSIYNTNNDLIKVYKAQPIKLLFTPESRHEYSNTNYVFLASIVEKVSGMTYDAFLLRFIFKPLKMKNSFVYRSRYKPETITKVSKGYIYSDSLKRYIIPDSLPGYKKVFYFDGLYGDGAIYSNIADLFKWDRALYTNQLITKKSMKEMFSPSQLSLKGLYPYGYGWRVQDDPRYGKIVSHEGTWGGFNTLIERHIDSDKTIIILFNNNRSVFPVSVCRRVLYGHPLPNDRTVSNALLTEYTGVYRLSSEATINIFISGNNLMAQATGDEQPVPIYYTTENRFFRYDYDVELEFVSDKNKKVTNLILYLNGKRFKDLLKTE